MFHTARAFRVGEVGSAEELAEKLTAHTWTLCRGFRLGRYLFLNDATHEDGPQEFVVVKAPTSSGRPYLQVQHVTVSGCDYESALGHIRRALAGQSDSRGVPLRNLYLESAADHDCCQHCV